MNESSFDEMATELAVVLESKNSKWIDTIRVYCGIDRKFFKALHVLISMDSIPSFCMFSCHCMCMDSLFQNRTCDASYTISA